MSNSVVTLLPYAGGVAGLAVAGSALFNYRRDAASKDVTRASVLVDSMLKLNQQLEKSNGKLEVSLERAEAALERAEEALERAVSREDALAVELRTTTTEVKALRADVAHLEQVIRELKNASG